MADWLQGLGRLILEPKVDPATAYYLARVEVKLDALLKLHTLGHRVHECRADLMADHSNPIKQMELAAAERAYKYHRLRFCEDEI